MRNGGRRDVKSLELLRFKGSQRFKRTGLVVGGLLSGPMNFAWPGRMRQEQVPC